MKKLKKRFILYFLIAAFALLVTYLPEIYSKYEPYRIIRDVELKLGELTGREVHISNISVALEGGPAIRATGVYVVDEHKRLMARVENTDISLSLTGLLRGRVGIDEAAVEGAALRLYKSELITDKKEKSEKSPEDILKSVLQKVRADSIRMSDVWVMMCTDRRNTMVSDCFSATINRSEFSLKRNAVKADVQLEGRMPWYMEIVSARIQAEIEPSAEKINASVEIEAKVDGLTIWDKWENSPLKLPELVGDATINADAEYNGGFIELDTSYSTSRSNLGFEDKELELENASVTAAINAKSLSPDEGSSKIAGRAGRIGFKSDKLAREIPQTKFDIKAEFDDGTITLHPSTISFGKTGKQASLNVNGRANLESEKISFLDTTLPFSEGDFDFSFDIEDASPVAKLAWDPDKKRDVGGRASGRLQVKLSGGTADGKLRMEGKGVTIDIPGVYGDKPGLVESVTATGEFSLSTRELKVSGLSAALGSSRVRADGSLKVSERGIEKARADVEVPVAYYSDVRPLLARGRMKEGSREFFLNEFEEAKVSGVFGKIRWDSSFGGKREFLRKGVQAGGNIESATIDFGEAVVNVRRGKASMYWGSLSFFDIVADVAGSEVRNMRADIESLGEDSLLVLYPEDKFRAGSLMSLLRNPRLDISDEMQRVRADGEMNPSGAVVEIPLKEGSTPSMHGSVALNGVYISMAGLLPLMKDVRGTISLDGKGVKAEELKFGVADMKMASSLQVPDFSKTEAEIRVRCDNLFPEKYFDAIPPLENSGDEKTGKKETGAEIEKPSEKTAIKVFLRAPKGRYKTFHFQSLIANMLIDESSVKFRRMNLQTSDGKIEAVQPSLVRFDGPEMTFRVEARDLNPEKFVKSIGIKNESVSGDLRFDGMLYSGGESMDEILANLNGRIGFRIREGKIESSNVLFQTFSIINFDWSKWKARRLGYRQIKGELFFNNGRVEIIDISMKGFFLRIAATGWVDLKTDRMEVDMGLVPLGTVEKLVGNAPIVGHLIRASSGKSLFAHYFRIKGPLDDYEVVQLGPEGVKDKIDDIIRGIMAGFR